MKFQVVYILWPTLWSNAYKRKFHILLLYTFMLHVSRFYVIEIKMLEKYFQTFLLSF